MIFIYTYENEFKYVYSDEIVAIIKESTSSFKVLSGPNIIYSNNNIINADYIKLSSLVQNYSSSTPNYLMNNRNTIIQIPVLGSSPYKVLHYSSDKYEIIDCTQQIIAPSLYNDQSDQILISNGNQDTFEVINIPTSIPSDVVYALNYSNNIYTLTTPIIYCIHEFYISNPSTEYTLSECIFSLNPEDLHIPNLEYQYIPLNNMLNNYPDINHTICINYNAITPTQEITIHTEEVTFIQTIQSTTGLFSIILNKIGPFISPINATTQNSIIIKPFFKFDNMNTKTTLLIQAFEYI